MKGVVFRGDKKLEILHFDDPIPGPGEAILEMKASGMCGSDLHFYRNKPADVIRWLGFKDLVAGYVGGHTHHRRPRALRPNHRPWFSSRSSSLQCRRPRCGLSLRRLPALRPLPHRLDTDVQPWCGYSRRDQAWRTCSLHEGLRYVTGPPARGSAYAAGAAVSCGTGTAWGALLRLDISARDTLAVFGLGPVGLSAVQLAAAMGVEVIGVDIAADRVEHAKAFGAAHVIDGSKQDPIEEILKLTGGLGATCAMDCAGGELPKQQAVRCTRPWGRIALVAVDGNLNVDGMKDVIGKQRTIIGSYTFSEVSMKNCIHFVADHGVDVDKLFTDRWRLEQAEEAYRLFDGQAGGKGVFMF